MPAFVGLWRANQRLIASVLGAAFLGSFAVGMTWGAELGVYQDYDLLVLFAVPCNLLVLLWLSERLSELQLRIITAAIFASNMCFGVSFLVGTR